MAIRGRYDENGKTVQHAELRTDGDKICSALTHVLKDEMILLVKEKGVSNQYAAYHNKRELQKS